MPIWTDTTEDSVTWTERADTGDITLTAGSPIGLLLVWTHAVTQTVRQGLWTDTGSQATTWT